MAADPVVRRYCRCGSKIEVSGFPPDVVDGVIDIFQALHGGDGHGPATPAQARRARARAETQAVLDSDDLVPFVLVEPEPYPVRPLRGVTRRGRWLGYSREAGRLRWMAGWLQAVLVFTWNTSQVLPPWAIRGVFRGIGWVLVNVAGIDRTWRRLWTVAAVTYAIGMVVVR